MRIPCEGGRKSLQCARVRGLGLAPVRGRAGRAAERTDETVSVSITGHLAPAAARLGPAALQRPRIGSRAPRKPGVLAAVSTRNSWY